MKKIWQEYYKGKSMAINEEFGEIEDEEDSFLAWNRSQSAALHVKDEFESFITSASTAWMGPAYQYWLQSDVQRTYPDLSCMALDILSCPSMSAEAERVFSGARRTLSWDRMRLGLKNIEQGEMLKSFV